MTVLKATFSKNKPHEIMYRNYKYFNSQNFNDELKSVFSKENIDSCNKFNQTFLNVLNKHPPLKRSSLELIILHMCLSLCVKLSWEGPTWKMFISKKEQASL